MKARKIHYRLIDRNPRAMVEMRVACGTNAHWTRDTTSDPFIVDCERCLKKIQQIKAKHP